MSEVKADLAGLSEGSEEFRLCRASGCANPDPLKDRETGAP